MNSARTNLPIFRLRKAGIYPSSVAGGGPSTSIIGCCCTVTGPCTGADSCRDSDDKSGSSKRKFKSREFDGVVFSERVVCDESGLSPLISNQFRLLLMFINHLSIVMFERRRASGYSSNGLLLL
jgi:hypothetical protein